MPSVPAGRGSARGNPRSGDARTKRSPQACLEMCLGVLTCWFTRFSAPQRASRCGRSASSSAKTPSTTANSPGPCSASARGHGFHLGRVPPRSSGLDLVDPSVRLARFGRHASGRMGSSPAAVSPSASATASAAVIEVMSIERLQCDLASEALAAELAEAIADRFRTLKLVPPRASRARAPSRPSGRAARRLRGCGRSRQRARDAFARRASTHALSFSPTWSSSPQIDERQDTVAAVLVHRLDVDAAARAGTRRPGLVGVVDACRRSRR